MKICELSDVRRKIWFLLRFFACERHFVTITTVATGQQSKEEKERKGEKTNRLHLLSSIINHYEVCYEL